MSDAAESATPAPAATEASSAPISAPAPVQAPARDLAQEAAFGVKPRAPEAEDLAHSTLPTADSVAREMAAKDAPAGSEGRDHTPADPSEAVSADGQVELTFGGVKFKADTPEAAHAKAEHTFSTLRGTFKATELKRRTAEANYSTAATRASQWEQTARQLGYQDDGNHRRAQAPEVAPAPQPPAPAAAAPAAAPSTPGEVAPIDWSTYQYLLNDPEGGVGAANFFLVQEQQRVAAADRQALRTELAAELRSEFEPVLQDRAQHQAFSALESKVVELQSYVNPAGHPQAGAVAYPELSDIVALGGIGEVLREMGISMDDAPKASPLIWHQAVLTYRYQTTGSLAAPTSPNPPAPELTVFQPQGDSAAAAALAGVMPPAVRAASASSAPAGRRAHPEFGVAPR